MSLRPLVIAALAVSTIALILEIVALVTDYWVSYEGMLRGVAVEANSGLFRTCLDGSCSTYKHETGGAHIRFRYLQLLLVTARNIHVCYW